MTDLDARADLVTAIAVGNFGKVISCDGNVKTIEVPADVAIGLAALWGMGGSMHFTKNHSFHLGKEAVAIRQLQQGLPLRAVP